MEVRFSRDDIIAAAQALGVALPKNVGDVIYSFRYRVSLPAAINEKAPPGNVWLIRPAGRGQYAFCAVAAEAALIMPNAMLVQTKIPDSTPGVIARYAKGDEQALLARLRYNRMIDLFTGVACYSLQNHLRTTVQGLGQVETDEVYIGIDRGGAHYVFPVQAKGGRDTISVVQIEQDICLCAEKFPAALCRPIAAQFMAGHAIALFEFRETAEGVRLHRERHYRLVPQESLTDAEIADYRSDAGREVQG
jgi:hypothetical protein